jgi:hypothetical protein
MPTVLGATTTKPTPTVLSAMQDLPQRNIQESKTNPRRQFEETNLAELADNIRLHGVLSLSRAASRMRGGAQKRCMQLLCNPRGSESARIS